MNKTLLPIIIALILIPAILVGIYLIRLPKPQKSQVKADVLFGVSLSPVSLSGIAKDSDITLDLILHTTGRLVSAVDVELQYPDSLKLSEFKADSSGSGLDTAVIPGTPDNFSNTLRYVAVNKSGNLPVRNTIRLGQLRFKAVKDNTTSKVEITKAKITIPGEGQIVEPSLDAGEYSVGISSPSPSPSPSASSSVSPSPSPSPSPAPSCINGAVKGRRCVDNTDFVEWFKEWSGLSNTKTADFFPECNTNGTRGDGKIDFADYEIWRREIGGSNKCQ